MRAVSSTYASPRRSVLFPVGLTTLNAEYFVETDHKMVSRIAVQMAGAAQLPCPTPNIRRNAVVIYSRADMPWPVLILYTVLLRILVSICAAFFGRPSLRQHNIAWGGNDAVVASLCVVVETDCYHSDLSKQIIAEHLVESSADCEAAWAGLLCLHEGVRVVGFPDHASPPNRSED